MTTKPHPHLRPRARNLADPKGTRALVDRLRVTTTPTEFAETYGTAMGVVEDYIRRRMRMAQKSRRAIDEWAERLPVGTKAPCRQKPIGPNVRAQLKAAGLTSKSNGPMQLTQLGEKVLVDRAVDIIAARR